MVPLPTLEHLSLELKMHYGRMQSPAAELSPACDLAPLTTAHHSFPFSTLPYTLSY